MAKAPQAACDIHRQLTRRSLSRRFLTLRATEKREGTTKVDLWLNGGACGALD